MVTIAVKLPTVVGLTDSVTVSAVAVALVTVPTAPLLNTTVFCSSVVSKPTPLMVIVSELIDRFVELAVTAGFDGGHLNGRTAADGVTRHNCVRLPTDVGAVLIVTVSVVAVAAVTVPAAPLLRTTVLLAAVGLKPKPLIVNVVALIARLAFALDTTGATVAICTAVPLAALFVVTMAVKLPADVGLVLNVTVSVVAVAVLTVPTAPLLNVTVLLAAVVSKPMPLMTTEDALALTLRPALALTTGITLATCTAVPLVTPPTLTLAVSEPPAAGLVEKVTVKLVADAVVTSPSAPLLRVTTFSAAVGEKPKPAMVTVVASAARLLVDTVITGVTVATCVAAPLLCEFVVTTAVNDPAVAGLVENVTVSRVAVAVVTVPTAPLLNTTVLLAAVGLKPKPAMVMVAALAARLAVLLVTTGTTVATWTAAPLATLLVVTMAVKLPAEVGLVPKLTVRSWP